MEINLKQRRLENTDCRGGGKSGVKGMEAVGIKRWVGLEVEIELV